MADCCVYCAEKCVFIFRHIFKHMQGFEFEKDWTGESTKYQRWLTVTCGQTLPKLFRSILNNDIESVQSELAKENHHQLIGCYDAGDAKYEFNALCFASMTYQPTGTDAENNRSLQIVSTLLNSKYNVNSKIVITTERGHSKQCYLNALSFVAKTQKHVENEQFRNILMHTQLKFMCRSMHTTSNEDGLLLHKKPSRMVLLLLQNGSEIQQNLIIYTQQYSHAYCIGATTLIMCIGGLQVPLIRNMGIRRRHQIGNFPMTARTLIKRDLLCSQLLAKFRVLSEKQSLAHICRDVIRATLGKECAKRENNLFKLVPELMIPKHLQNFLLYDFDIETMAQACAKTTKTTLPKYNPAITFDSYLHASFKMI